MSVKEAMLASILKALQYYHPAVWGAHSEEELTQQVKRGLLWLIHYDPYYIVLHSRREVDRKVADNIADAHRAGKSYRMINGRPCVVGEPEMNPK